MHIGHQTRKIIKFIRWKPADAVKAIGPMIAEAKNEAELCKLMEDLLENHRCNMPRLLIDMMKLSGSGLAPTF